MFNRGYVLTYRRRVAETGAASALVVNQLPVAERGEKVGVKARSKRKIIV